MQTSDHRTHEGAALRDRIDRYLRSRALVPGDVRVVPLTGDASDRRYFRILGAAGESFVLALHAGPIEFAPHGVEPGEKRSAIVEAGRRNGEPHVLLQGVLAAGHERREAVAERPGSRKVAQVEALRLLSGTTEAEIVAVATTQEEVGLRGAQTSAFHIEADIAVALDITLAMDTSATTPVRTS